MNRLNKKDQKNQVEAEATIRKTKCGQYYDLSKHSLVKKNKKRLTKIQLMNLFSKLRLRFTLTPKCNIWCVFCSNEGSNYLAKSKRHANVDLIIKLSNMLLKATPLKSIDFSGGEPTIHPDFINKEFKLINWTKKYSKVRFSLHSNGINLDSEIIDRIKNNFSRVGISVHSLNFDVWNKITNLNNRFSKISQKLKFRKIINNLEYIHKQGIGHKIFLKSVIMRNVNDSQKELTSFLEFCNTYQFHPKFLEFEPQYSDQRKYIVSRKEFFKKLEKIGCKFASDVPRHNNPNTYIPGVNFDYKNVPSGLHSIFGCGLKATCETCYDFLCMFVKPYEDGNGLYLKPCSILDTRIDLTHAIETENYNQLIELFRISREYLMLAPGLGISNWGKELRYKCF